MPPNPNEGVAYLRVSTDDQADKGVSLKAQRECVTSHAERSGLTLLEIIEDAGFSAKTLERPGMQRLLQLLKRDEIEFVLITKLDRLSRRLRDFCPLVEDYFAEADGPALITLSEGTDLRTSDGRMTAYILMAIAQKERETIVSRTQEAMTHKRSKGQQLGTIPYGQQLGDDGVTLVPLPSEQLVIEKIRTLHGEGWPLRSIAAQLDTQGFRTRTGKPWASSSVSAIIKRIQ